MPYRHLAVVSALALLLAYAVAPAQTHAEPLNLSPVPQSRAAGLATAAGKAAPRSSVPVTVGREAPLLTKSRTRVAKSSGGAAPTYQGWMSPEVADAWATGFRGQGATITTVDEFSGATYYSGNLGNGTQSLRHGEWTRLESSMIAPSATMASHDFLPSRSVTLAKSGLNVANLSYGMFAKAGYSVSQISWSAQEASLITYARNGTAMISKSAGNDSVAVVGTNRVGNTDYLNLALVGAQSAIFVGALDRNGTVDNKANLASYSNFAGGDPTVQNQFLTVGVRGDLTRLYGTSLAAPVVSGYAAVLGSKFTSATPTQITRRLLDTARTDTINGYNASVHGKGEASLTRALAPISIN